MYRNTLRLTTHESHAKLMLGHYTRILFYLLKIKLLKSMLRETKTVIYKRASMY